MPPGRRRSKFSKNRLDGESNSAFSDARRRQNRVFFPINYPALVLARKRGEIFFFLFSPQRSDPLYHVIFDGGQVDFSLTARIGLTCDAAAG